MGPADRFQQVSGDETARPLDRIPASDTGAVCCLVGHFDRALALVVADHLDRDAVLAGRDYSALGLAVSFVVFGIESHVIPSFLARKPRLGWRF